MCKLRTFQRSYVCVSSFNIINVNISIFNDFLGDLVKNSQGNGYVNGIEIIDLGKQKLKKEDLSFRCRIFEAMELYCLIL